MEVSLLLAEGHAHANRYPLAKVWFEARIVRERMNGMLASQIALMHTAMATLVSSKPKEAIKHLNKQLKDLRNGH